MMLFPVSKFLFFVKMEKIKKCDLLQSNFFKLHSKMYVDYGSLFPD